MSAVVDDAAGAALCSQFAEYWPEYRAWMAQAELGDAAECAAQLRSNMPELSGMFDRLVGLLSPVGDRFGAVEGEVTRFLSLYCPPRLVRACSQLVLDDGDGAVLIRSYDHHPDLFDGVLLKSEQSGTPTLAVTDCMWGALDGVNAHGCVVALAFGGRNALGPGFAAPLIVRYVLETCRDVTDARAALARAAVYMPYTFVVADASGGFVTAFLSPDREAVFVERRTSANHQGAVEWPAYCAHTESVDRLSALESLVGGTDRLDAARGAFVRSPLWRHAYSKAAGTLYVAEYRSGSRSLVLRWPGREERFSLDGFEPREFSVDLSQEAGV